MNLHQPYQAVELEHRLGVDVCLAGARLHLDVQLAGSHTAEKLLRLGDLVASLHRSHVCQYVSARKRDGRIGIALGALVAEVDLALRTLGLAAQIAQVDGAPWLGCPSKTEVTASAASVWYRCTLNLNFMSTP